MGDTQASSQRKRLASEHEHDHDNVDDEQPPKRFRLCGGKWTRQVEDPILACPMYKYDPVTYRQCENYLAGGSTTLNRIR